MTRHAKRRAMPMAEINVVPYIDVMLVLLVIFMVTAPLLAQGVRVDLPQASAKPLSQDAKEPLIVSVDKDGLYYFNAASDPQRPLSAEKLSIAVIAQLQVHKDKPVLVNGDQSVDYGKVVNAMVILQKAGVPNVGLITKTPDESKS